MAKGKGTPKGSGRKSSLKAQDINLNYCGLMSQKRWDLEVNFRLCTTLDQCMEI